MRVQSDAVAGDGADDRMRIMGGDADRVHYRDRGIAEKPAVVTGNGWTTDKRI